MSRIKAKKRLRTVLFYICAAIVLAVLFVNKRAVFAALISFLNVLAEAFDSLAGR